MRIGAPLGLVVVKPVAANGFAGSAVMKSISAVVGISCLADCRAEYQLSGLLE